MPHVIIFFNIIRFRIYPTLCLQTIDSDFCPPMRITDSDSRNDFLLDFF